DDRADAGDEVGEGTPGCRPLDDLGDLLHGQARVVAEDVPHRGFVFVGARRAPVVQLGVRVECASDGGAVCAELSGDGPDRAATASASAVLAAVAHRATLFSPDPGAFSVPLPLRSGLPPVAHLGEGGTGRAGGVPGSGPPKIRTPLPLGVWVGWLARWA